MGVGPAASVAAKPPGRTGGRRGSGSRAEAIAGYSFVSIPMLLFLILNIGAILYAVYISVWDWNIRSGPVKLVGLDNYTRLLNDEVFQTGIKNTLYYTAIWVPLTMAAGLFLAVIVNAKIRGRTFFRAAFYFPAIASSAAITTLWIFIVQPNGLFNQVRGAIGLNPLFEFFGFIAKQNWMGDQDTALQSVILLNTWTTSGTFMLFYLASLQTISREVYEAAAIDGANAWQTFWRVTFPLLRPGHYFVATVAVIGGLQLFDQALIGGGVNGDPNNALMTTVLFIYNASFKRFDFSLAAAAGVILFVVILTATLVQRRLFGQAPSW
ncbi:MAG: multiple sugar transport system permease protein [Chloroflexota bacterium]|jgi:multiple sugar transport system permease protein|nr:multiple sugar transport system permease protein [Chloroflexota bacterium]